MPTSTYPRGHVLQPQAGLIEPQRPHGCDLVCVASSAGGINALKEILFGLPEDFPIPMVIVQHLPQSSRYRSVLDRVLLRSSKLPVKWAEHGECVRPGTVYLAPQDHHTILQTGGTISISTGERIGFCRPAADPLFASAARVYGHRAIGIVLSGSSSDGAEGASELIAAGARVFVQQEESCLHPAMPRAVSRRCNLDAGLLPAELARLLVSLAMGEESWAASGIARGDRRASGRSMKEILLWPDYVARGAT